MSSPNVRYRQSFVPVQNDVVSSSSTGNAMRMHVPVPEKECKQISANLRPEIIDDMGLLAAIDWHIHQYRQYYSHIQIVRQIDMEEQEIPEALKIVIYRVIKEALNNAAMHSKADTIYI